MCEVLLISRLKEYIGHYDDPWIVDFDPEEIETTEGYEVERFDSHWLSRTNRDSTWHARRIRHLMRSSIDLFYPVCVDNKCSTDGHQILPIAILVDGWHRWFAHLELGYTEINASYGGRMDVLEYLRGDTDKVP